MRNVRGVFVTAMLASTLVAGPVQAGDDGLVLRAVGWYQGESSITEDTITCQIPDVAGGFPDGSWVMGLNNSFGIPTTVFPDDNNPYGNPCGGWIQLWNSMKKQGINVTKLKMKYRIAGARRFRGLVAQRGGFPLACRELRRQKIFTGARLNPNDPFAPPASNSGLPNVAFVQIFPQYGADLLACIRDEYGALDPDTFSSLSIVARTKAFGIADNGDRFKSNTIRYTLTLTNTCGNGRIDIMEECDPTELDAGGAPAPQCSSQAFCVGSQCASNPGRACTTSADCIGSCTAPGARNECSCVY